MDNRDRFFEEEARIERVIHVASVVCDPDCCPETFDDFVETFPDYKSDHPLFARLPFLAALLEDGNYPEPYEVADAFIQRDVRGLLIEGAATVYKPQGGGIIASGWGMYRTRWFHANDIADAEEQVLEWAVEQHKRDMEKEAS